MNAEKVIDYSKSLANGIEEELDNDGSLDLANVMPELDRQIVLVNKLETDKASDVRERLKSVKDKLSTRGV